MASTYGYQQQQQRGFSLIEMLTTISIVAILATVAIPNFDTMMKNTRRTQTVENFWHAIFLARSEAIKRNSVVALCKSSDGTQCDYKGNWSNGWIVFENRDNDSPAQVDSDEPILRVYGATTQVAVLTSKNNFIFRPFAQTLVNGTVTFCDERGSKEARAIIISHTGRPRQSTRNASNQALSCSDS
jgi:type IV fimbrial biogenesis protein FimT